MLDLKFRAWVDNEMVYLPFAALQYFDFEGSYALSFVVDGYHGFWAHECYEKISKERCTNAPIMRFSGLIDKNGKDVYEGDIIKFMRVDYYIGGSGEWLKGELSINKYGIPSIGQYQFGHTYYFGQIEDNDTIEVIGNIYENPELLNKKPFNPLDHEQTK